MRQDPALPFDLPRNPALGLFRRLACHFQTQRPGRSLIADDLGFCENIALFKFLLQVIDYGQCVICVIITVEDEPEAAPERLDHLGICGVLHLPCVIAGPELKAPNLITLNDGMGNIPEQLVNMLETLCRAVKADVIVPTAQQRI